MANDSYLMDSPFVVRRCLADDYGDYDAVTDDWSQYDRVVNGSIKIGGQEHFYLETENCIVVPGEVDEFEIITSTQSARDVPVNILRRNSNKYEESICRIILGIYFLLN